MFEWMTTGENTPIYPTALIGYRVWRMKEQRLYPLHVSGAPAWQPGTNTADCVFYRHRAPAADCKCGFNAHHQIGGALTEAAAWYQEWEQCHDDSVVLVIGAIAARGEAQVHHHGFRSEEAQILGLTTIGEVPAITELAETAAYYQVPVYTGTYQLVQACRRSSNDHLSAAPKDMIPPTPDEHGSGDGRYPWSWMCKAYQCAFGARIGIVLLASFLFTVFVLFSGVIIISCGAVLGSEPLKMIGEIFLGISMISAVAFGMLASRL